jgi:hypothetical protein
LVWAVSLSSVDLDTHALSAPIDPLVFEVSVPSARRTLSLRRGESTLHLQRALPQAAYSKRSTNIDFAENQISLSSIGFSPLITVHPNLLQQIRVRPLHYSMSYKNGLTMISSLSFGSNL